MPPLSELSSDALTDLRAGLVQEYEALKAQGLKLDMTRGKPASAQLDLSAEMLALPGNRDTTAEDGTDARNYGNLQGLAETRALFSTLMGAPADQIVVANNSSLALMHDTIVYALLKGVPGGKGPWSKEEPITFLCPVPGYDRHFALCEGYGIRMIAIPMTGAGPDMDAVEKAVADPSVKGIWCVPKYANPSGETYSAETVRRLASMKTGAPDFRIFWDNAYAVHHLSAERPELANILDACAEAGNPNRAFIFASTSKVTLAGAGLALWASSPENVRWYLAQAGRRSIGPDKLNQLRHVRFLRDDAGIAAHMEKHRELIAPKFTAVEEAFAARLGGQGVAQWSAPKGGYFITLDVQDGTASRVVALAKEAGIALTPAGATHPYGKDPNDRTLRIAPTFPSLADVRKAAEAVALCTLLAAVEARLG
ncbi:aminotransferase class I/II-fold pyridoxal phosphate-dependent enzyme [Methylobacterium gregans]|uniref:Aminotransferase/MSMEI_6121 n=1 Tax=Methylobacterium gregans TaxID=374424 RepID=A0AA37MBX4_9HYPH|nr:aminotransferase class I/II-fold pyridoxal phosphate-dependent enzyme [Methylobacterium gregans]MDQ0520169.1 DNA-binding transcriptional MocR family regulator [Methylobacterium gregans]GJD80460.1 Putative aminotransferase/MSMEI_6121 [Methylobacterium gregans]GLS52572.1 aminotransferase [Methylobacterium gregans]